MATSTFEIKDCKLTWDSTGDNITWNSPYLQTANESSYISNNKSWIDWTDKSTISSGTNTLYCSPKYYNSKPYTITTGTTSSLYEQELFKKEYLSNYIYKEEPKIRYEIPKYDWDNNFYISDNWSDNWNISVGGGIAVSQPVDPAARMREIIRSRMSPVIMTSRTPMSVARDAREARARDTLRTILTEQEYRGFLKNGFVTVVAKSGLVYQIFPGHGITCVYDRGKMTERLCVVLQGNYTDTDSIIMRYLLILNDEAEFRKYAIKHSVISRKQMTVQAPNDQPLTEVFEGIRIAA